MRERSARRRQIAVAALVVALPLGYLSLDALDVVPGFVTSDLGREDRTQVPESEAPAGQAGAAGARQDNNAVPRVPPPLAAATPAPLPTQIPAEAASPALTTAGLTAALRPQLTNPALGPSVGMEVRDASGAVLFAHDAGRARTPASTTKVLTAVALAQAQDLTQRFETRAVLVAGAEATPATAATTGASAGVSAAPAQTTIALVAGGDNLLAPDRGDPGSVIGQAGLGDLARATAAALEQRGTRGPVRVVLDDTYARGPALAPGWQPGDVALGLTGPVAMLGLATDRAEPYRPSTADPALHATAAFAGALTAAGLHVEGRPSRAAAPPDAAELATVASAPIGDVLAIALDDSDNDLTETLARWGCHQAGAPTTFAGCAAWVRDQLTAAGIDVRGVRLTDTSGLSGGSQVPVTALAAAMAHGASGTNPSLSGVLARLPVAGLTGTLDERFLAAAASRGVGLVRAKTGTLTGVSALAGSVVDADGRMLTFAIVADRVPGTVPARLALDRLAATLAACGCR